MQRADKAWLKQFRSGYCSCACRDCMEIAIGVEGDALCHACDDAGCERNDGECQVVLDEEDE